jgi:beta-phosphoglucomutase
MEFQLPTRLLIWYSTHNSFGGDPLLKAVIFDCDGIIADNEPLHLRMFQKVLGEEDIPLTEKEYYDVYLGMDDKGCFTAVLSAHGRPATPEKLSDLIERKARYYREAIDHELILFPGVRSLVQEASKRYRLAVASGALLHEIELILKAAGIREAFNVIVSAEDVSTGKPDPEGFNKALSQLNASPPKPASPIQPKECLVIEDSIAGVQAAQSARMRCLAVTNSYTRDQLKQADLIVESLEGISPETLERFF